MLVPREVFLYIYIFQLFHLNTFVRGMIRNTLRQLLEITMDLEDAREINNKNDKNDASCPFSPLLYAFTFFDSLSISPSFRVTPYKYIATSSCIYTGAAECTDGLEGAK